MKSSLQYLKDRQSYFFGQFKENQEEQNELLNKLVDTRAELIKIQVAINEVQIAIEKLEKSE